MSRNASGGTTISHLFINTDYDAGAWSSWCHSVTSEGSDTINKVIISICSFCTTEQKLTFCPKHNFAWVGVQKRTGKSEKFFYPKNGGICISTNAYHSVWKSSKNVSVFVPKWGQNAAVPFFCVLDTVSTPSLPRKNFKGDKVMIRFFMPIYSPINSEIGLNLKRATLQGIKP